MRRAPGLVELSRRDFCAFACGAAATVALASCTGDGPLAIQTGGLSGNGDGDTPPDGPDGSDGSNGSGSAGSGSGSGSGSGVQANVCPSTGAIDTGFKPTAITSTPSYYSGSKVFIGRDSGGVYAMTAVCTHQGATCVVQGAEIYCPRHGATFSLTGTVTGSPATTSLKHYAMCVMSNGNLGVITSMTVSASQRLNV
jgi:nitrite reductase/ring-hydroxylating ferredoxin subunit